MEYSSSNPHTTSIIAHLSSIGNFFDFFPFKIILSTLPLATWTSNYTMHRAFTKGKKMMEGKFSVHLCVQQ